MLIRALASLVIAGLAGCNATPPAGSAANTLVIASWNLEHLAEQDSSGCRPRTEADYAALRGYASALNADIIAIQEVESIKAAQRVFDPSDYTIFLEERTGTPGSRPPCYGAPDLHLNRQAVGFAVRKSLNVVRHPDLVTLQDNDPNLRSGVDIEVRPATGPALRLLAVHLKSGCAGASAQGASCETLARQAQTLRSWIADRAAGQAGFAVLGDFNRRLALDGDVIWAALDHPPGPADMTLASGATPPGCDPRYTSFIDHIVFDPRLGARTPVFRESLYEGERLSDHCAVSITVSR